MNLQQSNNGPHSGNNLFIDAAVSHNHSDFVAFAGHNARLISEIHMEDLTFLEADLADYEKIGLIFLLYGSDPTILNVGLQNLLLHISNPVRKTTFLYEWARNRNTAEKEWREMLIEALCIVQAFHVTDKLGLYKQQLEEVYLPYRSDSALCVNKIIKALYMFAESSESSRAKLLIKFVSKRKDGKIAFDNADYLEVYFLHWIQKNVIRLYPVQSCQVDILLEFMSEQGLKTARSNLEAIAIEIRNEKENHKTPGKITPSDDPPPNPDDHDTTCYKVNRESCGFVLIINQRDFVKEQRVQGLKDYNVRMGTEHDSLRLKTTFEARGYKVIVRENLNNKAIIDEIRKIVDASICYDSLIVCILSHGEDGYIIAANCIPIPIREIQKIMASEKLLYKPKMLIVQACQGGAPQTLVKSNQPTVNELEADGIEETTSSPHADLLTALSTISGFASFRDRVNGTWYIQEMCQVIDDHGDTSHVLDLLLIVNNKVSQKSAHKDGKILGQLPEAKLTLRRKFFFPKRLNTSR